MNFVVMLALEAKGYLAAYREILCFMLAGLAVAIVLYMASAELVARGSLFEPFTVGVVDHDGRPELVFIFDFFNEYVIALEYMELEEALNHLEGGGIPAFVELPQDFTQDVFYGLNSPFTVHVSEGLPLQAGLVQLLASGGIAYLSASQAGVHATLEYAVAQGMPWEEMQRTLLIPVNLAFAQELIRFDDMFRREVLSLLDTQQNPAEYFIRRFAVFWYIMSLIVLINYLPAYSQGIMARFKLAAVPAFKIFAIKWGGLAVALAVLAMPLVPFLRFFVVLALVFFLSSFALLVSRGGGLLVFLIALLMYFASGGIIPFVFLPRVLLPMRWLSLNYLAAEGHVLAIFALGCVIAWFSFLLDLKLRVR